MGLWAAVFWSERDDGWSVDWAVYIGGIFAGADIAEEAGDNSAIADFVALYADSSICGGGDGVHWWGIVFESGGLSVMSIC